jgi:hypothetical protein
MKTIEISDEMYDALVEISTNINNQDNRCTASPYFYQVQTKKEVAAYEGCGTEVWYNSDLCKTLKTEEDIKEYIIEDMLDNMDPEYSTDEANILAEEDYLGLTEYDITEYLEEHNFNKYDVQEENVYENMFFTEKACDQHIKINKHNMNEPRSYVQHAYRNPELEVVIKFLSSLTK